MLPKWWEVFYTNTQNRFPNLLWGVEVNPDVVEHYMETRVQHVFTVGTVVDIPKVISKILESEHSSDIKAITFPRYGRLINDSSNTTHYRFKVTFLWESGRKASVEFFTLKDVNTEDVLSIAYDPEDTSIKKVSIRYFRD